MEGRRHSHQKRRASLGDNGVPRDRRPRPEDEEWEEVLENNSTRRSENTLCLVVYDNSSLTMQDGGRMLEFYGEKTTLEL